MASTFKNLSGGKRAREALIVLVGITANWRKRRHVRRFLQAHSGYDVYVPALPYRKPLKDVVAWYEHYLETTVRPDRYESFHAIAYIAASSLLRCMPAKDKIMFERMVYFRGPYQELVASWLIQRVGRFTASLIAGNSALDLANGWPSRLPRQTWAKHEALIIEEGRSSMAKLLGITQEDIEPSSWEAAHLLPGAKAVLRVPESHDDVYTSDKILSSALSFIQHGDFQ